MLDSAPMGSKWLRFLGLAVYLGLLAGAFVLAAYLSFNVFVRSGAVRAPQVVGLTATDAARVLADQGLVSALSRDEGRFSEEVPAAHVAEQRPSAGSLVKTGSQVELVLSQGPQRVTVPRLGGQTLPSVEIALATAGLGVGRTVTVLSADAVPGTVVEQWPAAGDTVAPGAEVNLLLAGESARDTYLTPDLVYRDYEQVRRFFEQRGFRLGSVRFEHYEGIPEGVILRQFPLAGHPLSRREAVSLVVAR